ncbi:MAG: hypothetical protein M3Q23_16660 [Actinomycetota bacterium]|nr:hypothetical protein [Actinomycetota bacterium]
MTGNDDDIARSRRIVGVDRSVHLSLKQVFQAIRNVVGQEPFEYGEAEWFVGGCPLHSVDCNLTVKAQAADQLWVSCNREGDPKDLLAALELLPASARRAAGPTISLDTVAKGFNIFVDQADRVFGSPAWEPGPWLPLRSKRFPALLRRWVSNKEREPLLRSGTVRDLVDALEAMALDQAPRVDTAVRVAGAGGEVWIHVDPEVAAHVTRSGWELGPPPERPRLWTPPGWKPLPSPSREGDLDDLHGFVNLHREEDFRLLVAYLVFSFNPTGPYPVLFLVGPPGAGKSTAARLVKDLIDPSASGPQRPPRNEDDVIGAAAHSWLLSFDNVTKLEPWLADVVCRLATGEGIRKRKLYTDVDEVIMRQSRPVMLNAIGDPLARRPDLADRAVVIDLPRIGRFIPEANLSPRWEQACPGILGGVLDALVGTLRELPNISFEHPPRMADFAVWGVALERALQWPPGSFMSAYRASMDRAASAELEDDSFAAALVALVERQLTDWRGSPKDLLTEVSMYDRKAAEKDPEWPGNPRAVTARLNALQPVLESHGITIRFVPGRSRQRNVVITRVTEGYLEAEEVLGGR